jgi:hypothetical protein
MATNPYGAVWAYDFGQPKVINGTALSGLSAGMLVYASGTLGAVSSGLDSLAVTDIKFMAGASGTNFTGVVVQSATSGNIVPVAVEGVFILQAIGTATAGVACAAGGDDAILDGGQALSLNAAGRTLVGAASGGFALVYIK